MDRRWFLAALALAVMGTGCAARRPSYLLMRGKAGAVLLPPGVSRPDLARRLVTADIATGRDTCPPGGSALRASARGKRLRIMIDRSALAAQPQGWLWNWTADAESLGCIVSGEGLRLVSRIVEAVPLAPAAADGLLRARFSHATAEIGPESRLQVVTPIVRDGAGSDKPLFEMAETSGSGTTINAGLKASRDLLGFETAWYRLTPRPGGVGFCLTPLSAERSIEGRTESAAAPAAAFLRFSPQANYYRLFRKADLDGKAITQMLITAPTRAELDRRVAAIDADPALCGAPGGLCVVVPRRAAVNVWIAVEVNGKEIRVPGGTVRSAIEAAGEKNAASVLRHLTVDRPYAGRLAPVEFDRSAPDILALTLAGGERIRF